MKSYDGEFNDCINDMVNIRLAAADVDSRAKKWYDKIQATDNAQNDAIFSYACEVQRLSYLAGLKDGVRLIMELGVAVGE